MGDAEPGIGLSDPPLKRSPLFGSHWLERKAPVSPQPLNESDCLVLGHLLDHVTQCLLRGHPHNDIRSVGAQGRGAPAAGA